MNGLCGGTDNVHDEVWMGQHWDVTAVDGVDACIHPFRQEPFQFRLHGPIVVCHDVPARLRLPSDARRISAEEIESRGIVGRPDKLLLFLREVSRETRDAFRLHPEASFSYFDVFEDIGGWVRFLLALRCFIGVGGESGDVDESDDPVIGPRGRNHASAIGVADKDSWAADPPERPFNGGDITFWCVEAVLGGHHFVALRL